MLCRMNEAGYIPSVNDGKIVDYGIQSEFVFLKASTAARSAGTLEKLKSSHKVIIDPETNKLHANSAARAQGYNTLPYVSSCTDLTQLLGNSSYRLSNLVQPCVTFQVDVGSIFITAPYLLTNDWRSNTFITNIELLVDTHGNVVRNHLGDKVVCVINVTKQILADTESINYIINRYTEDHLDKIEAFIINADDLDDRDCDESILIGLARLTHYLGEEKPVIVKPVGGFGEILMAIGASGYSSGIHAAETFALANVTEDGFVPQRGQGWTYVPELFNYMQQNDLVTAGYTCGCPVCANGLPATSEEKKKHYLEVKMRRANEIISTPKAERVLLLRQRLDDARSLARAMRSSHGVGPRSTVYFEKWIAVLDQAQIWESHTQSDVELDELLGLIDASQA